MKSGLGYVPCAMKHAASLSTLRALSRAGLTAEAFIPAALEALHKVVPSYRNLFDWTDPQGNLVRYYFEGPIDHRIAAQYFEEFHNRCEGEVMPAFWELVNGCALIRSVEEFNCLEFFRLVLYNEIWWLYPVVACAVRDQRRAAGCGANASRSSK